MQQILIVCSVMSDSCDLMGCMQPTQAPLLRGFSRQECWSGLPFPSPGDLPNPGIEPRSPALQPTGKPQALTSYLICTQYQQCIYANPNLPIYSTLYFPPWCPNFCSLCLCLYFCLKHILNPYTCLHCHCHKPSLSHHHLFSRLFQEPFTQAASSEQLKGVTPVQVHGASCLKEPCVLFKALLLLS